MGLHSAAILDKKYLEMLKLLNRYLNHFPRHEKYGLALRIRNTAYELYNLIVEAQKRYHKKTTLTQIDILHEQLRMQIRLAHELGYFAFHHGRGAKRFNPAPSHPDAAAAGEMPANPFIPSPEARAQADAARRLITLQCLVDELGRLIGGWINHEREQARGATPSCA